MIEAVGAKFLPTYLRTCAQRLRPGGLFGLQAITIAALTNTVVKTVMVAVLGSASLRTPIFASAALVVASGAIALFFA
jgi:cyclopropane fatty-acyl-phospholipid synthase-like methyltransferase